MSRLLICVDFQNDFLEEGSLAVLGGKADVERTINFINNHKIDKIICSLDTHTKNQIFHKCYWQNSNGENPADYTVITTEDVINEKWIPTGCTKEYALEYLRHIEEKGKKCLCIWPYHCLIGTTGSSLDSNLAKVVYEHDNLFIQKGMDPNTEMYGIIKPEYDTGYINTELLEEIKNYDEIYVTGEAKSHCVLETIKQIVEYFSKDKNTLEKIVVLQDCMSSIPGFEETTERELNELANRGIKLKNSTDIS